MAAGTLHGAEVRAGGGPAQHLWQLPRTRPRGHSSVTWPTSFRRPRIRRLPGVGAVTAVQDKRAGGSGARTRGSHGNGEPWITGGRRNFALRHTVIRPGWAHTARAGTARLLSERCH